MLTLRFFAVSCEFALYQCNPKLSNRDAMVICYLISLEFQIGCSQSTNDFRQNDTIYFSEHFSFASVEYDTEKYLKFFFYVNILMFYYVA